MKYMFILQFLQKKPSMRAWMLLKLQRKNIIFMKYPCCSINQKCTMYIFHIFWYQRYYKLSPELLAKHTAKDFVFKRHFQVTFHAKSVYF